MKLRNFIPRITFGEASPVARVEPRFAQADGGVLFDNLKDGRLEEYLRGGANTESGAHISERTILSLAVAWRCASIRCGTLATLPCDLMVRVDEDTREPAVDNPFRDVLTVRPNNRQTPGEFKRMMQLHKLQCGDGFAMKIVSRGRIIALWPLDPLRMQVIENDDLSLTYRYSRKNGGQTDFAQSQIMHLRGLSWDGIRGLPVIRFMAESAGLSMQARKAAAKLFKNGNFRPGYIKGQKTMSQEAYSRFKESINEVGGVDSDEAGKIGILEEGFEYQAGGISAADAQLIEIMGYSRDDIGMFYGVPPFLYGDTQKSTSWGTGIAQQKLGFLTFTVEDDLNCWSETIKRDCLSGPADDPRLYAYFDLKGYLRADAQTRAEYLYRATGGRPWMKQNEARAAEELEPSAETWANVLPENGQGAAPAQKKENGNDPNTPAPPR